MWRTYKVIHKIKEGTNFNKWQISVDRREKIFHQ